MTDINNLVLVGRITRDLGTDERNFGYLSSGVARANISIAVNHSRKVGDQWQDDVYYFDVTIFGKTAENLKPYFTKGQQVAVEGYLKQDRWEKDGQKFNRVSVVANSVQLLGSKNSSGSSESAKQNYSNNSYGNKPAANNQNNNQNFESAGDSFPEDIPF